MDPELNVPESPVVYTKPKKPKAKKPKHSGATNKSLARSKAKTTVKKLRKLVKKAAKKLPKRKLAKKTKPARVVVRTERLDMRLSKAEKAKVSRIAKKLKRTLTSVVYEAIEKLK